jgi:hypothetical protein
MLKLLRVSFLTLKAYYIEKCYQTRYWITRLTDDHIFARTVFPRSLRHDVRLMMCDYLPPPQRGPGSVHCNEIKSFPFVRAECPFVRKFLRHCRGLDNKAYISY